MCSFIPLTRSWGVLCAVLLLLLSPRHVLAGELPGQFSDELTTDHYNCTITVQTGRALNATSTLQVLLEAGNGGNETRLEITPTHLRLLAMVNGAGHVAGTAALALSVGTPYTLTLLRRGTSMLILHDDTLLCHTTLAVGAGNLAAITAGRGWKVCDASIQRLEPVTFADDFMRKSDDPVTARGDWSLASGQWALQSAWEHVPRGPTNRFAATIFAQNPFAWIGVAQGATPAVCTTGETFWEDYTVSSSVFPTTHGAVGLLLNLIDAHNGLLVRWSSAHDARADGNQVALYKLVNGVRTLLAKSSGGFLPGQWYRMAVTSSSEGVRVVIDHTERINYQQPAWRRGGIGLYAEGGEGSIFDHVSAYGLTFDADLEQEARQSAISAKFMNDPNGMKEWAVNPDEWQDEQIKADIHWSGTPLYGVHNRLVLTTMPYGIKVTSSELDDPDFSGTLTMALDGDPTSLTPSGYRAVLAVSGTPAQQTYTLYRNAQVLASKTVAPLEPNTEYKLRLSQNGGQLRLEVDDRPVLQATDPHPLTQGYAAYGSDGQAFQSPRDVHAISGYALDYTFAEAPVDWYAAGTWMPSVRWSCTPTWSFLSGWSLGDAVLWHKERFNGAQSLEAFMGVKMEYPRERVNYYTRYHGYLAVTICGDGKDPRNGYCGIYGAPDVDGFPYQRAVLLRNGVIVASTQINSMRALGENHHLWFKLMLEKQGNTITFRAILNNETYELPYTDVHPIDGGIPAIWTHENAVSLARVRLNCEHAPLPWAGPQVVIDTPWYPQWANIGHPETLAFPESWSTSGKPVTLRITAQTTPAGEEHALVAHDLQTTFTPTLPGEHWYQITAGDGEHSSQAFHFDQQVFNPALGREDTHALLLYRFDEGAGTVVHDHAPLGTPLDLTVPADPANTQWLAGQGLTLRGPTPLLSATHADKLLPLAKATGCTLEFWVSTDTIFPDTWHSVLFSLGASEDNAIDLMVGQSTSTLQAGCPGTKSTVGDDIATGFTTSLHHYVVTWDAQETRAYDNGDWQANSQLILGQNYLGTYYLVAVHDRCFTPEEVKRHYQAGPSAK